MLVVKEEELCHAVALLNRNVPTHQPNPHADFQNVLVSTSGRVQTDPFSDVEAINLFEDWPSTSANASQTYRRS